MSKILLFAGPKQAGKTSAARFVSAYVLMRVGKIRSFNMDNDGQLLVPMNFYDQDGNPVEQEGYLDLGRTDEDFSLYAQEHFWPYVKIYSFADQLKWSVHQIFGIPMELLKGTQKQKETLTDIKWEDMYKLAKRYTVTHNQNKYLTVRQLLQYFGTDICRTLQNDCWINACLRQIEYDQPALAIIDDGRFPNEVKALKGKGAKVIRLMRSIDTDDHASEAELKKMSSDSFDDVINNEDMSLSEKNCCIFDVLKLWGWISGDLNES